MGLTTILCLQIFRLPLKWIVEPLWKQQQQKKKNAIIQATLEIIFNLQYVDRENILQNYTLRMTFNMRIYFSIVSDLS